MAKISKTTTVSKGKKPRKVETKTKYRSFRLEKRIRHDSGKKLSGSFRLFLDSASITRQYWKVLGGITLVYFILSLILVGLDTGTNLAELKSELSEIIDGGMGQLGVGLAVFASMISSAGAASSESGGVYRTVLTIMVSLAVIWALRQVMGGHKATVREAFYKGMYPLVPAVLVLLVIGLQLLPLTIGSFLYSVLFVGGLAAGAVEKLLWAVLIFMLVLLSLYLITSSIFAFYIVTLPDMRPMKALRSARELVRYRRWTVMRKLLFLPLALLVVTAFITLPLIWIWALLAGWVFLLLTMVGLVFVHTYIYSLYRELL